MSSVADGTSPAAAACDWRHHLSAPQVYPGGVELFRQGQTLTDVLLIQSGLVKVGCAAFNGHESIVGLAFSGEWLGTAQVIAGRRSAATAITCESSAIARMSVDTFLTLLRTNPELSWEVHRHHAVDLCRQSGSIIQLGSLNARQRLEALIGRFAAGLSRQRPDTPIRLELPLRHWELARLIGVSPEYFSRLLADMEQEGIIRRAKGWIVISDARRLAPLNDEEYQ